MHVQSIFLQTFLIYFLAARVADNYIIKRFVLPVCTNGKYKIYVHPILTVMLKKILRTFAAEILNIFKNIEPQSKR